MPRPRRRPKARSIDFNTLTWHNASLGNAVSAASHLDMTVDELREFYFEHREQILEARTCWADCKEPVCVHTMPPRMYWDFEDVPDELRRRRPVVSLEDDIRARRELDEARRDYIKANGR